MTVTLDLTPLAVAIIEKEADLAGQSISEWIKERLSDYFLMAPIKPLTEIDLTKITAVGP